MSIINPWEERVLFKSLGFANMPYIRKTSEVENHFVSLFSTGTFKYIRPGPEGVDSYKGDQKVLCKALSDIVGGKKKKRPQLIREAQGMPSLLVQAITKDDGSLEYMARDAGVQECAWYAVRLFLDSRLGLADCLTVCDASGCNKFVLTLGTGRPRKTCSAAHTRAVNVVHAREFMQNLRRDRKKLTTNADGSLVRK